MISVYPIMLFVSAISSAPVAGIFYAFSSFVMPALGRIPDEQGRGAMNAINVTVYTPSFMILFTGTALLSAVLAAWSLFLIESLASQLVLAASLLYLVGCFGVTIAFNVPLNRQLAEVDASSGDALWRKFLRQWTIWNSARTVGAGLAAALFILALVLGYGRAAAIA